MKFVVLGGYGIIGRVIVRDLFDFSDAEIVIAGRDMHKAKKYASSFRSKRVTTKTINVESRSSLVQALKGCDVCINALQYYFNIPVMKACLDAKVNYIDLGGLYHNTKKQLRLNSAFRKLGKLAILGCGSTPGITNVMASYAVDKLIKVQEIEISFGDYDKTNYNQGFVLPYSIQTIFDEFTMKPAIYEGKIRFVDPLSGMKDIVFPKPVGKRKGFLTLHSELATFPDSFKENELRNCYFRATFSEKFISQVNFLIDLGLSTDEEVTINRRKIKMKELASGILNKFIPKENTKIEDLEYVRVDAKGRKRIVMDCLTRNNGKYNFSAGVYDTGVPASIMAQMVASDHIRERGVHPPEKIVPKDKFFKELGKRNISILMNGRKIN